MDAVGLADFEHLPAIAEIVGNVQLLRLLFSPASVHDRHNIHMRRADEAHSDYRCYTFHASSFSIPQ